ncbi:MAG: UDP-N-acetylmuramoyl-tripeptide--D-alanyl-D-alanine ligase [Saprospiraceae bacterium]|nr:UDP-N-acetylmuramoyl-tripeptide--D-alanyl-D-alanine ligase [Saprospiraceae bacterium]
MSLEDLYEIYRGHPNVVIDSRKVEKGCLFFALKGANFDGNQFAVDAIEKGAAYAIIDNREYKNHDHCILVDDVLKMLQALATRHRRSFTCPVIGLTGSNGKTTTKELIARVLETKYNVHYTKGNFNNHIGVPLTLLSMHPDTEIAVIEMGANHQGEIDFLSRIAEPSHGLITNIGKAHLEGFGGIEGVKKGKSELYRFLHETGGTAFINLDEKFLDDLLPIGTKRIAYSSNPEGTPEFSFKLAKEKPSLEVAFTGNSADYFEIQSGLTGIYNYANIITAATLGLYFKIPCVQIKSGIESYIPDNNRSQIVQKEGYRLILDAYNANPTSMLASLQNFMAMDAPNKVAILGEMLELGESSPAEHEAIALEAQNANFESLVFVGEGFKSIASAMDLIWFENAAAVKAWIDNQDLIGKTIFLKGSRGVGLERIF